MNYSDLLDVRPVAFAELCRYVGWDAADVLLADPEDDVALWAEIAPPTRDAILHIAMLNKQKPTSIELKTIIALHYGASPSAVLCAYGWVPPSGKPLTFEEENCIRVAARTAAHTGGFS